MIEAAIFDMDGVLIDSEPYWREAETAVLQEIGFPVTKEMVFQNMGVRIDKAVDNWFKLFPNKNISKKLVVKQIVDKTIGFVRQRGKPKEGVIDILKFLGRKKIKIGIASSAPMQVIEITLNQLNIEYHFHVIHSGENEKNPKPHPDVFLTAAKKLNVNPKKCITFEDSPVGVTAAKKAGMLCVAIVDQNIKDHKSYKIADFRLTSLKEFDENLWQDLVL